ncbi:MAG: tRNA (adenosine(37)-N6)-threonylcarbamoyltransferase complex dimerization subunit type 1 TsaB [Alphaproteobacteria bacterium]
MYGIVFDVCGKYANIALLKDGETVEKFSQSADFGQADFILPQIKELTQKQGVDIKDLAFVSATTGPGSFAGLRAGISIVKGLSIALPELKVIGINCFEVYLSEIKNLSDCNLIVIETKREDFYVQMFNAKKEPLIEPLNASREDIISMIKNKKVSIIGDGVERFLNVSTGIGFNEVVLSDCLSLKALCDLAYHKYQKKEFNFVKPLYIKEGIVKNESC